jgi:hypothetical protein
MKVRLFRHAAALSALVVAVQVLGAGWKWS